MYSYFTNIVRRVRRKRWTGWLPPIAIAGC
jgi:hypothetical protein